MLQYKKNKNDYTVVIERKTPKQIYKEERKKRIHSFFTKPLIMWITGVLASVVASVIAQYLLKLLGLM